MNVTLASDRVGDLVDTGAEIKALKLRNAPELRPAHRNCVR